MKITYDNQPYFSITRRHFTATRDRITVSGTSLWQKIRGHLYVLFGGKGY